MSILLIIAIVIIIYFIYLYNKFVTLRNSRENAFSDINVQLKLRFDLVENLVNTVKGYADHEKDTLEKITQARTSFMSATNVDQKIEANNNLAGALKSLFAVSESYPELKANTNFLQLQTELSSIENNLASARRYFNATTRELNTGVEQFPGNIVANMFAVKKETFFELEKEEEKATPKVSF